MVNNKIDTERNNIWGINIMWDRIKVSIDSRVDNKIDSRTDINMLLNLNNNQIKSQ